MGRTIAPGGALVLAGFGAALIVGAFLFTVLDPFVMELFDIVEHDVEREAAHTGLFYMQMMWDGARWLVLLLGFVMVVGGMAFVVRRDA